MNLQTKLIYNELSSKDIKSILNIGFRYDSDKTIMNYCLQNNKQWTILEIFKKNCEEMISRGMDVICDDVRNIKNLQRTFDAVIWLHGPEHIEWDEFLNIRHDIESKANKKIIYQAPIGIYEQGELYNNPWEKHVSTLYPTMFYNLGYEVIEHNTNGEFTFSAIVRK
jgi:hypothetical protein